MPVLDTADKLEAQGAQPTTMRGLLRRSLAMPRSRSRYEVQRAPGVASSSIYFPDGQYSGLAAYAAYGRVKDACEGSIVSCDRIDLLPPTMKMASHVPQLSPLIANWLVG